MSKRPCPFEENCAPQQKIHVSEEDINRQNEEYMKAVYERTMGMLFQGVNNNNNSVATTSQAQGVNISKCPQCTEIVEIVAKCWFCEISLCKKCDKICTYCYENFCSSCSVPIYKNGNNYTCLTCYK